MLRLTAIFFALVTLSAAPRLGAADTGPVADNLGYRLVPPNGWTFDAGRSDDASRALQAQRHYDGLRTSVGADAYVAAEAALLVQWIHARDPADNPELLMRRTFDQIRGAAGAGQLVSWSEDVRNDIAGARLEWRQRKTGQVTLLRALVFVTDTDELRQVRAECVLSTAASDGVRAACERALASLTLTEATGPRGSIGAVEGAGTLRLSNGTGSQNTDDPADDPARDPIGDAVGTSPGAPAAAAPGDSDEGAGDVAAQAPELEPPSLYPAPDPGQSPPRVLYQASGEDQPERSRTDQLMILAGAVLLVVAIYMTARGRRRRGGPDDTGAPGGPGGPGGTGGTGGTGSTGDGDWP